MKYQAFHNHSGGDQISHDYLILLDQRYNKYLNSICSEVDYYASVTGKNEKVDILENQLLTLCQVYCERILLEPIIK